MGIEIEYPPGYANSGV